MLREWAHVAAVLLAPLSVPLNAQQPPQQPAAQVEREPLEQWAIAYEEREDFDGAIATRREILERTAATCGETHWRATDARLALARTERIKALKPEDRRRLREARSLTEQILRLEGSGQYGRSIALTQQVADTYSSLLGPVRPEVARALIYLGKLRFSIGEYDKAESLFQQATDILKRSLGTEHPDYATSLSNLAAIYESTGAYARAEPLYVEALDIYRQVLGESDPQYATSLNNLAQLYLSMEDYVGAKHLLDQATKIHKEILHESPPDYARALTNLATLYRSIGEYSEAESLLVKATEIRRQALHESHPDYAKGLGNLAFLYESMGDLAKAESFLVRAMDILRGALGESHPDYAECLSHMALLSVSRGEYAKAETWFRQMLAVRLTIAERVLPAMSESRGMEFLESGYARLRPGLFFTILGRLPHPDLYEAYEWRFRTRAFMMRELAERKAQGSDSPEATALRAGLRETVQQLAQLTLATTPPEQREARRKRLADLSGRKDDLEARLAAISAGFQRARQATQVRSADLARLLDAHTAVVDFAYVWLWDLPGQWKKPGRLTGQWHYEAFVIRPDQGERGYTVALIDLGEADAIDQAIARWRKAIVSAESSAAMGRVLRRSVWERLDRHLAGCSTVILIPDGQLCLLPWAALPGRKPGTYLMDEYAIGTAPSAHLLCRLLTEPARAKGGLLAIGGVDYDSCPASTSGAGPAAPDACSQAAQAGEAAAKVRPAWPPLPGTGDELAAIERLWRGGTAPVVLRGAKPGEDVLRRYLPGNRCIHLATHGFFADDDFRSMFKHDLAGERLFGGEEPLVTAAGAQVTVRNPLILSGLVLAGANRPPETDELGLPIGDDGILTAEEIAAIDLGSTELVVLSACSTGLGRVAGGEGVMGLQRAFHLAGARTVIASLWQVDDKATQALMAEFYKNLWEKKLGTLEALRQAQRAVLCSYDPQSGRLRGPGQVHRVDPAKLRESPEITLPPFYWATFVLSGDWR